MDALIRRLLPLFLLPCLAPAAGAEVHLCRDAQGARVYQDQPCEAGATALGVRTLEVPVADPSAQRVAREEAARIAAWERASRERLAPSLGGKTTPARSTGGGRGAGAAPRGAPDACAQARATRDAAYRREGNRMGFDRRRALQDALTEACGLR